jgi:hypothetical protein
MTATFGGFIGALIPGLFRFSSIGFNLISIGLWVISFVCLITAVSSFIKARKLGKQEDELKLKKLQRDNFEDYINDHGRS